MKNSYLGVSRILVRYGKDYKRIKLEYVEGAEFEGFYGGSKGLEV